MKIAKEVIDDVLYDLYNEIYIQKAQIIKKDEFIEKTITSYKFKGAFFVPGSLHLKKDTGHINLNDYTSCLSQLAYVGIAQLLKQKPGIVEGIDYDLFKNKKINVAVGEFFFRPRSIVNEKDFTSELDMKYLKKWKKTYFLNADYKVENKPYGLVTYAFNLNQ
ncbi:MAG: FcoT family thioesterase [Candidatus Woesearchaeota archaeon]